MMTEEQVAAKAAKIVRVVLDNQDTHVICLVDSEDYEPLLERIRNTYRGSTLTLLPRKRDKVWVVE